jgi:peptide-methionine (S)-S-oxide reductase
VTQIAPLTKFYKAEKYHQSYFNSNPSASYCAFVIRPKLDKVLKKLGQPGKPAAAKTPLP